MDCRVNVAVAVWKGSKQYMRRSGDLHKSEPGMVVIGEA